jgi:hypothetical protein
VLVWASKGAIGQPANKSHKNVILSNRIGPTNVPLSRRLFTSAETSLPAKEARKCLIVKFFTSVFFEILPGVPLIVAKRLKTSHDSAQKRFNRKQNRKQFRGRASLVTETAVERNRRWQTN